MDKVRTGLYEAYDEEYQEVLPKRLAVAVGTTAGIRPLKRFDAKAYHEHQKLSAHDWFRQYELKHRLAAPDAAVKGLNTRNNCTDILNLQ